MSELHKDHIGAAWLAHHYQVFPIMPFFVKSQIGGRRYSKITEYEWVESYPAIMRPASDPVSHLLFHLRHEVIHLEFLARLFRKTGPTFIQEWINAEPTSKYARIAAFLYEWLTGDALIVPERINGNYVDVIDGDKLVAASVENVEKVRRWRVNNNIAGTPDFCPMVYKSESVLQAMNLNISDLVSELVSEFGDAHLYRLSKLIINSEGYTSVAIEDKQLNRTQRFADVTLRRAAKVKVPLDELALAQLQKEILGDKTNLNRMGLRQSPAFVASTIGNQEIVQYVAPPAKSVPAMLKGLQVFLERTQGQSSIMRSAVAAFGLIYIHPLADGNGRVHRFLINDILRRDGIVPELMSLPISTVIASTSDELFNYQRVLDVVAKPLMHRVREFVTFKSTGINYPDGVLSSFDFTGEEDATSAWRYPNLSQHIVYLSNLIYLALTQEMRVQARDLRRNDRMLVALKEIVEMPNHQANLILRSIKRWCVK